MPVVEALAAGVPVVASDLAVFREFAADIPDYADPIDPQRWLALISDYTSTDSPLRAAQIDRIRSFRPPTWEQHFRCVNALLTRLGET